MNSSQTNTSKNPPPVSASSPRDNPCLEIDPTVAALGVFADDGIIYLLPYAHFLYAERLANPSLEKEPEASPEEMRVHFVKGDVVIRGSGLNKLERLIQKYELKFVRTADRRLAATLTTHVSAVIFILTKENV